MSAPAPALSRTRASVRAPRFRTDIQALRAVAIGLVVLNHLWPAQIAGGFVGVDVFFVISGFLITGHLLGEVERTGRIGLAAFYARRIRRLLPAALLVLAVTLVGVWLLLPYPRWADNAVQALASALYLENWTLAGLSVDYSAHNAAASAVQHYWSLSVEEQFYLLWPLLVLGATTLAARRLPGRDGRRWLQVVVLVVLLLSFAASVAFTAASPSQAYFVTFTRVWEFAAGAAIALIPAVVLRRINALAAAVLATAGYAGIAIAAFLFGPETGYPGSAALLPVVATAAVILAGTGRRAPVWAVSTVTDRRPVQWLGEVSYSLYLWHWPLIVFAPFVLGAPLTDWSRIAVLAAALVLAGAGRRWIEIPSQRADWWRPTRLAFLGGGVGMAVVVILAVAVLGAGAARGAATQAMESSGGACHGAASLMDPENCDASMAVPDPVVTSSDAYFGVAAECGELQDELTMDGRQTTRECDFSAGADAPRVWLVGDSHAEQWQAAVFPVAREEGWLLTISSFPGCPPADVAFVGFDTLWGPVDYARCRSWADALSERIVAEAPDLVITSMAARQQLVDDGSGRPHDEQFAEGLRATWDRWIDAGVEVVPIRDTPLNGDVRDVDCLLLNASRPIECAVPRATALPPDPVAIASAEGRSGLWPLDLSALLCDDALCFAAVGGEPVFYDADHLSSAYAATLSEPLRRTVDEALAAADRSGG